MGAEETLHAIKKDLFIRGCVFSIYSAMGPEAIFVYPFPNDITNPKSTNAKYTGEYTQRNYMQVAIKSISLLITDYSFEEGNEELLSEEQFGILPYPDMKSIGFTYFCYFKSPNFNRLVPTSLSLLVHENKRSFLFDNSIRLKPIMKDLTKYLIKKTINNNIDSEYTARKYWTETLEKYNSFFHDILEIQEKPLTPIATKRKIKILFTGLEGSGKTSFLLTLNRRFSNIASVRPSKVPNKEPFNFLGTTLIKWDIPGHPKSRKRFLQESDLFIYESDVLYYFINIQNPKIDENIEFLKQIKDKLIEMEMKIPIIFIFSHTDEDIAKDFRIRELISEIKTKISEMFKNRPIRFFETSIFSTFSILNAFSFGIQSLSPNCDLMKHILDRYLRHHDLITGILANNMGLVLVSSENEYLKNKTDSKKLSIIQIFELTASNFTSIAQQFATYLNENGDKTEYWFSSKDVVIVKKFIINNEPFFFLFYTKSPEVREEVDKSFIDLAKKLKDLLILYLD